VAVNATAAAATQTAAPAAATSNAATAAANAQIQTATAQAAASQAAAAQTAAANNTATAAAAATQTAAVQVRLAYIYTSGTAEAGDFQALLQQNGFRVDLLAQNAIGNTDFRSYQAVLIGPETGREGNWGDEGNQQVDRIVDSGAPILGIGEGGFAFFGRADLAIGWNEGITTTATSAVVVDADDSIWETPFRISIPADQTLPLYSNPTTVAAVTVETPLIQVPLEGLELVARLPGDSIHYSIIYQFDRLLWGYSGSPSAMTPTGQQVFINAVRDLLER
jgi:hypothetical protein